jgi:hypothetical protein
MNKEHQRAMQATDLSGLLIVLYQRMFLFDY